MLIIFFIFIYCLLIPSPLCTWTTHWKILHVFCLTFILTIRSLVTPYPAFSSPSEHITHNKLNYNPFNDLISILLMRSKPISSLNHILQVHTPPPKDTNFFKNPSDLLSSIFLEFFHLWRFFSFLSAGRVEIFIFMNFWGMYQWNNTPSYKYNFRKWPRTQSHKVEKYFSIYSAPTFPILDGGK